WWRISRRSGAARATTSPRTSYAAGRTTVPQRPAAKRTTRTTKSRMTSRRARARRLVGDLASGVSGHERGRRVGSEIVALHDPLATAALLEEERGVPITGAERDSQDDDAQRPSRGARDRLTRYVEHIHHRRLDVVGGL